MSVAPKNFFKETDFTDCKTVIAAVSGGSDSLSLMFLLNDFLKTLVTPPKLIAVTVDHRLREESALEAQTVADICKKNNIEHATVCWADSKPQTALSYQARIARYGLLFSEAQKIDATVVMTGHTLNDQAETYHMRLSRGSNRGLACMPRESLLMRHVRIIRPFLQTKREDLRDYLRGIDQTWIDDPSNDSDFYERVRVRKTLTDDDINAVEKLIETVANKRRAQSKSAAELFVKLSVEVANGLCKLSYPSDDVIKNQDFSFVLGVIIAIMGGSLYLPTDKQLSYLQDQFEKTHDCLYRFTMLGSVVETGKNGIKIWRESRNQSFSILGPGLSTIWDGRYKVVNNGTQPLRIGPASLANIKAVIARENLMDKKFHYLSLQSSIAFFTSKGVDVPAVDNQLVCAKDVECRRFMHPFGWLVSSDDYLLFDALRPVFELSLSSNQKNMIESA